MYARRRDGNHASTIAAFKALGCSVIDLGSVGRGVGDLLVGYGGLTIMVEIKNPLQPPSKRKLTKAQEELRRDWTGGCRLVVTSDDIVDTVAVLRRWKLAISKEAS